MFSSFSFVPSTAPFSLRVDVGITSFLLDSTVVPSTAPYSLHADVGVTSCLLGVTATRKIIHHNGLEEPARNNTHPMSLFLGAPTYVLPE